MVGTGDRVLVAVSGGADSTALLHLFLKVRRPFGLDLVVGHFNHRLRGDESEDDERFVSKLAEEYQLPFFCESVSCRQEDLGTKTNQEDWAREKRYEFLRRIAKTQSLQKISVGHTMNDQAETLLMRLVRGSGTLGLAAIPIFREDGVIRPLLHVTREEILEYLAHNHLSWREDSSNSNPRFLRNRIRHELIPLLRRGYNPNIVEVLSNTAAIVRDDIEVLGDSVKRVFQSNAQICDDKVIWDVDRLSSFPKGLQRNLIRFSFQELKNESRFVSLEDVNSVLKLLSVGSSGKCRELSAAVVSREFQYLVFQKRISAQVAQVHLASYSYDLSIPGTVRIPQSGSIFEAFVVEGPKIPDWINRWEFYVTPEEKVRGLCVRNWRPGDAYCPAGASRPKKLKELFARGRIPKSLRRAWPVVTIGDKIIFAKNFLTSADRLTNADQERTEKVIVYERELRV